MKLAARHSTRALHAYIGTVLWIKLYRNGIFRTVTCYEDQVIVSRNIKYTGIGYHVTVP